MTLSAPLRRYGGLLSRRRGRHTPIWVVVPLIVVVVLAMLPVAYVIAHARLAGWGQVQQLVFRPHVAELLANTVRLTVGVTLASLVLGAGTAFLVERTDVPGRRWWRALLPLPLAVPAFVTTYGWVSLTPDVEGYWGAVGVLTLAYFPLVELPVAAALRGLDPAWRESARTLGHGPVASLRRLTIPLLRPALAAGGLLVALHILAEFGALSLLRFHTFTTAIFTQYSLTFDSAAAAMLAGVLLILCAVALTLELLARGRARYARLGSGAARPAAPLRLGRGRWVAVAALTAALVLALGIPVGTIAYWAATGTSTAFPVGSLVTTALNSVSLSLGGALLTVLLAVPVAIAVVRRHGRAATVIERMSYLGGSLPGLVVALALVFVTIRVVEPLYQTRWLVMAAYATLYLPLAVATVRPKVAQAPVRIEEQARVLGRRPWRAMVSVTLPVIAPGVAAAAALVFLASMRELTATLLLRPTGVQTLATEVWAQTSNLSYGAAAPYALLLIVVSVPATLLLTRANVKQSEVG